MIKSNRDDKEMRIYYKQTSYANIYFSYKFYYISKLYYHPELKRKNEIEKLDDSLIKL